MKFLTPLILIIVSGGLCFLFIMPHFNNVNTVRDQIKQYDEAIVRADRVESKRTELLNNRNTFKGEDIDRLQKFLPDYIDSIRLLIKFNNITKQYGTTINDFKLSSGTKKEQTSIGPDTVPYGTFHLQFSISLTYEQFLRFLKDIENNLQLFDVTSLSFQPDSRDKAGRYNYSVDVATYWLK